MATRYGNATWLRRGLSLWLTLLCAILSVTGCDAARSPESPDLVGVAASISPSLPAPSQLSSTLTSYDAVSLVWLDNTKNETGFEVHRSTTGPTGTFTLLASTAAAVTNYGDQRLGAESQYCYEIRAFRTIGNKTSYSSFSNVACSTTPPNAPSSTTASPVNSSQVSIGWADRSATEDGFRVERSVDGGATWTAINGTAANQTRTTDVGLTAEGPQRCYRVIAYNGYGSSPPSATVCTTPPAPPTNLTAAVAGTAIVLAWTDNSAVEDGYEVRRFSAGQATTAIASLPANATGYTDAQASGDVTYFYYVGARKDGGYSDLSNPAQAIVAATPPTAPSSAQALPASSNVAEIAWQDNAANESGFRVERSTDGGSSWTTAGTVGTDASLFDDDGQPAEQQLCYRVIAFNDKGVSPPSNVDCTALPIAPTGLVATAVDYQTIDLTWSAGPPERNGLTVRDGYTVFRYDFVCYDWGWTCDYEYEAIAALAPDATSYRDGGLTSATSYSYFVAANNDGGMSDPSDEANTVTPAMPGAARPLPTRVLPSASMLRGAALRAVRKTLQDRADQRARSPRVPSKVRAPRAGKSARRLGKVPPGSR